MATFNLGTVTSPIAQAMRLAQLQEAQNPNLALERQIQKAVELQRIQQQSPEGQLALKIQEAQLNSALQNQAFRQQQQGLQLEAMRRAIPTDLESALQQAVQQSQARQLGIIQAPQIAGQPAALPALPVSEAAQRAFAATPEGAPLIEEIISPLEVPVQVGSRQVFDPVTARAMQQQAAEAKILESERKLTSEESIKQGFELERITARNAARNFRTYINPDDPTDIRQVGATERPPDGFLEAKDYLRGARGSGKGAGGGGGDLKPTGETQEKFLGAVNVLGQTEELLKEVEKYKKEGNFPGYSQTAINQFLTQRPQDIPGAGLVPGLSSVYAAAQRAVRTAQTPEARNIQMRRSVITATILRVQAGLSQTLGETVNITPYTPVESDTYESLVDKLEGLDREGKRAISNYRELYPQLRDKFPGVGNAPSQQSAPTSSSFTAPTIQEAETAARKAGFTKDSGVVILNGVPGTLD